MNSVFESVYDVGRDVSFDEAMIATLARVVFRVYMKDKPIKRGIKLWCVNDSITRFCYRVSMYSGARVDVTQQQENHMGILGATLFVEVEACGLLDVGAHVVCDRAFTNLALALLLRQRNTTLTGTLNRNRKGVGATDFEVTGERGSLSFGSTTLQTEGLPAVGMGLTVWMDRKPVFLLSTEVPCGGTHGRFAVRRNPRSSATANVHSEPFWEPFVRYIYNKLMGGVDGNDQLRSFNHMRLRRIKRWPLHVFIGTLDIAVVNALICFWDWQKSWGVSESKRITGKDFRLNLVRQIITKYCEPVVFPLEDLMKDIDTIRGNTTNTPSQPSNHTPILSPSTDFNFTFHNVVEDTDKIKNGKHCAETLRKGVCVECVDKLPSRKDDTKAYRQAMKSFLTSYYCTHPACAEPRKHSTKKNFKPYLHPQCIETHTRRMNNVIPPHDDE